MTSPSRVVPDLLPCPFCGTSAPGCLVRIEDYVECGTCGALGPVRHGIGWNTRTAPSPDQGVVERVAAAMWNAGRWHPEAPIFAHEHAWESQWPEGSDVLRDFLRLYAQAALSAIGGES